MDYKKCRFLQEVRGAFIIRESDMNICVHPRGDSECFLEREHKYGDSEETKKLKCKYFEER